MAALTIPDLAGKRVLITGASTGIGAAVAKAFAAQGAKVGVHYNASREAAEAVADDIRKAGGTVALIHGAADQVVDPAGSRDAAEVLAAHGFDVGLHISPGVAHGIAPDGLDFATAFLVGRFGGNR